MDRDAKAAASRAASAVADAGSWLATPALPALVAAFARDAADHALVRDLERRSGGVTARLARLDAFTDRWDTRRGRERHQALPLTLTGEQERLALAAARALGLCGGTGPRHGRYDHLLILGGTVRGCLLRTAHAARLLDSGRVTADRVTALGGHRPFSGDEREVAAAVGAPHLDEEYAALDFVTRSAFRLGGAGAAARVEGERSPLVGGTWGVRHYRTARGTPVRVAAAPSGEPGRRRAHTADTYAFFARHLAELGPGDRVLAVTSAVNVPAQHAAAVRMLTLPHGAEVDTVGSPPDAAPAALARPPAAADFLLEIRSAVRSLRRLCAAAAPAGAAADGGAAKAGPTETPATETGVTETGVTGTGVTGTGVTEAVPPAASVAASAEGREAPEAAGGSPAGRPTSR
ncbi:hypothetical protein [Streptomyces lycii]|uniref:hypothetical protein n=1 Tax=Streptomyces lycii TaxID=2654337 RepID=UPI001F4807F3|nr:hypothetical protein [Streptomyces lycii]